MSHYVTIKHPKLGEAEVMPSSVHVWTERGWSVVDDPEHAGKSRQARSRTRGAARKAAQKQPAKPSAASRKGDVTAPAESA